MKTRMWEQMMLFFICFKRPFNNIISFCILIFSNFFLRFLNKKAFFKAFTIRSLSVMSPNTTVSLHITLKNIFLLQSVWNINKNDKNEKVSFHPNSIFYHIYHMVKYLQCIQK